MTFILPVDSEHWRSCENFSVEQIRLYFFMTGFCKAVKAEWYAEDRISRNKGVGVWPSIAFRIPGYDIGPGKLESKLTQSQASH